MTLSKELIKMMPEEVGREEGSADFQRYFGGYNDCLTRVKEILGRVEIDEDEIRRTIVSAGQLTSKYPSKSRLIAGDKVFISHEQFDDLAKAIANASGIVKGGE